ncbi:MAG: tyrosine--tRNA ligase [Anaerolineae bacterium]|nr:tyrosine--tRNA ligase [Anaerolineae bacterium]MDX9833431.1 tyrosine--tRNA ligase [Anaerolineae bacterium]
MTSNVIDVLAERGFIEQVSDAEGLRAAAEKPITCYVGFDPSADSFHVGHLVPIMALAHMQRHGHRPIAVMGGGTGMVGDPSGKTEMRQLLDVDRIDANLARLRGQVRRLLDFAGGRALMVNNADWLRPLNYLDFLREIGRHFSVNRMLAAEAYRTRYESEGGLNFLEFNYMLLQSYDFLHLYREMGCILQMGGSDQWGNILSGVDLIRRVEGGQAFAITFPLVTTASGAKMGKTAAGAVWLDAEQVSPFEYYQYWINTEDADVGRFLALFTFLPMERVRELGRLQGADVRQAKEVLAFEATRILHGEEAAAEAQRASRQLFGRGVATEAVPTTELPAGELETGILAPELFERVGLCRSRSEARRLIEQGGAWVNDRQIGSVDERLTSADLEQGALLLRAGKKRYHRVLPA